MKKISKNKLLKYAKRLPPYMVLFAVLVLLSDFFYGYIITGRIKWYFFIIPIILFSLFSFLALKKKIRTKIGIIITVIVVIVGTLISWGSYSFFNKIGATNGEIKSEFTGVIIECDKVGLSYSVKMMNVTGKEYSFVSSEKHFVDEELKIEEYQGNFKAPVYIVTNDAYGGK